MRHLQVEISTHLHVLHININMNYDSMTTTGVVLDSMHARYGSAVGWHYTSPSGIKPDLHHALLGKNFGGGLACAGVICRWFCGEHWFMGKFCQFG